MSAGVTCSSSRRRRRSAFGSVKQLLGNLPQGRSLDVSLAGYWAVDLGLASLSPMRFEVSFLLHYTEKGAHGGRIYGVR